MTPAQVPGAPGPPAAGAPVEGAPVEGAPVAGPPAGEPPAKKYALRAEPQREEHVPTGPVFIPKREAKKTRAFGARHVVIVILCVLAIAYAVISIAFKPMHGFLLGTLFDALGKPETALKQYRKAAGGNSMWADKAEAAIERIGKRAFAKHLDLQYYHSWTANSKIAFEVQGRSEPIEFSSSITYRAPGSVTENITGAGVSGQRVIDEEGLTQRFASARAQRLTADQYSQYMDTLLGFGPDTLFKEKGKDDVIEAFYDQLDMRMSGLRDHGDERVYSFTISFEGDRNRMAKFAMLAGPFFPWNTAVPRIQIAEVNYLIRARDGCLVKAQYMDNNGIVAVSQTFEDFKAEGDDD